MKEYMSVKEYAAATGLSFQAVYKSIKAGKIPTEERTIDGKRIKVIVQDDDHAPTSPAVPDPVLLDDAAVIPGPEDPAEDPDRQDDTAVTLGPEDPARNDGIKALEKAVEALTQQLAEKDRQIASLMQLLHDQQELQAHSQLLLSQPEPEKKTDPEIIETPPEPVKKTDPEIIETPPEPEKPKRRSFWAWLFE